MVAGLIPWLLTGWRLQAAPLAVRVTGGVLIALGLAFLLHAFARFVVEGLGTPAPVAPTARLVVGGIYRYVRNPMYLAVGATIVGQALWPSRAGCRGSIAGRATDAQQWSVRLSVTIRPSSEVATTSSRSPDEGRGSRATMGAFASRLTFLPRR